MLQELLDRANKVEYVKPIKLLNEKDIPSNYKSDCKRIVDIFRECGEVNITEELAYQLWHTHSQSFCGSWETMNGLSDKLIFDNLLSLIEHVNIDN